MDCCTKRGSMLCTVQSMDCTNPCFAHNRCTSTTLEITCCGIVELCRLHPSSRTLNQDFVESIKNTRLQQTEVMVSFDIKSSFTNVPVHPVLGVSHEKLLDDESLEKENGTFSRPSHPPRRPLSEDYILLVQRRILPAEGWSCNGIPSVPQSSQHLFGRGTCMLMTHSV